MLSLHIDLEVDKKLDFDTFSLDYITFEYKGLSLPISFNAFSASEFNTNVVSVRTGYGLLYNDFELDIIGLEEVYEELGLEVDDITAEFLSSLGKVTHLGGISSNKILSVKKLNLSDITTGKTYKFKGDISDVEFDFDFD